MVAFIPVEEVQSIHLGAPWDLVEKEARDFFREEWVEEPIITMWMEALEEAVVLMEMGMEAVEEAAEATLEEVAEKICMAPAGEGEDLTMLEKISKINVATIQLDMAR